MIPCAIGPPDYSGRIEAAHLMRFRMLELLGGFHSRP